MTIEELCALPPADREAALIRAINAYDYRPLIEQWIEAQRRFEDRDLDQVGSRRAYEFGE